MDRKVIEKILSNLRNENNGIAVDHLISRISGMSQEEIDLTVQKLGGTEEAVRQVLEEKVNQLARREAAGHEPHKPMNKLFSYGISQESVHLHLPVQLANIKGKGISGKINTANRYLIDAMDRVLKMKDSGDPRFRNVDSIYMISPILMGKELEVLRQDWPEIIEDLKKNLYNGTYEDYSKIRDEFYDSFISEISAERWEIFKEL